MSEKKPRSFVAVLRGLREPASAGQRFRGTPKNALKKAIKAAVDGRDQPIIEWLKHGTDFAVAVDIDCPSGGEPLASHHVVDAMFPERLPRPLCGWRTHNGGLRAIFVMGAGWTAFDLAAAWYLFAPLGALTGWRVEMLARSRHPAGDRPDGGQCGPISWFEPSEKLVVPHGQARGVASEAAVEAFMERTGFGPGRHSTADCPMPQCGMTRATKGSDPIIVDRDSGIRCFRCKRFASWDELAGDLIPPDLPTLRDAARELVHSPHQRHVLANMRPQASAAMLSAAWKMTLSVVNTDRLSTEEGKAFWGPKIAAAGGNGIGVVRGIGNNWLQAETLIPRTKFTKTSATALPWAHTAMRIEEAQDIVQLAGFTRLAPLNNTTVLGPYSEAPAGTLHIRRARRAHESAPVDLTRRPSTEETEAAWHTLEQALPGLNRGYLSALIVGVFFAQRATGFTPMFVVSGDTGAGKTTTQHLAGAAVGAPTAEITLADGVRTSREIGTALESGAGLLFFDEIGRVPNMYFALQTILRLNADFRFEAKYRNPTTLPVNATVSLLGSTLPFEVLRSPELQRRSVAFWLGGKNSGWERHGKASQARQGPLRQPLDIITASLWWLTHDLGPGAEWRPLMLERFGATEISEMDFDDQGGEGRAESIRLLYEVYRNAPPADFYQGAGYPNWLTARPGTPTWAHLSELVDLASSDKKVRNAQIADLKRTSLGSILGFDAPALRLHVHRRSAVWILKFAQPGIKRGDETPRGQLPPRKGEMRTDTHETRTEESQAISTIRTTRTSGEEQLQSSEDLGTTGGGAGVSRPSASCATPESGSFPGCDTPAEHAGAEVVIVDFETRSLAPLQRVGGRAYAAANSTEVICAVALLPDGSEVVWRAGDPEPTMLFEHVRAGTPVAAHNWSGFDRFIWERLEWPTPEVTIDTARLARLAGLPGKLEKVGEILGVSKDMEGRKFTNALSRADRKTGLLVPLREDQIDRVVGYCRRDVEVTSMLMARIDGRIVSSEASVQAADDAINERGFGFDVSLARALVEVAGAVEADDVAKAPVEPAVLRSPAKLRRWLSDRGVQVSSVKRGELEQLLDDDLPLDVVQTIQARIGQARITKTKITAGLQRVGADGRLRDLLRYHAAHTGRWSATALQPHNLPRGVRVEIEATVLAVLDGDVQRVREIADDAGESVADVLATLVRACIIPAPGKLLAVVDYSSIEARGLAWMVGDEDGLEAFRRGEDVYKIFAQKLFGLSSPSQVTDAQRQLGKVAELGGGYQMGVAKFESYGRGFGIDWETSPLSPKEVIETWRDEHPLVAGERTGELYQEHVLRSGGLWRRLQKNFDFVARMGGRYQVDRVWIERVGADLHVELPSGRHLVYPDVRIEVVRTKWGTDKEAPTYRHRGNRVSTYGGKLTENIVQAICRDLLAEALVRLEREGVPVVLHVHDEVLVEVDAAEDLAHVERLVAVRPHWANGFPIAAEGFVAKRYRK